MYSIYYTKKLTKLKIKCCDGQIYKFKPLYVYIYTKNKELSVNMSYMLNVCARNIFSIINFKIKKLNTCFV